MFTVSPTYRRFVAPILLTIFCGAMSPCRQVAAQQVDRAPELQKLIAELVDVLHVRYYDNVVLHRTQYDQVRRAIAKWNASARSSVDYELMAGWLRAALRSAEQSSKRGLPPMPTLLARVSHPPLKIPTVQVARKPPESPIVEINLAELHSRIRGTNRELQKVEMALSSAKQHSARELNQMAKLLSNLVRQRNFLALYYQSLDEPEKASTPRLLPTNTAKRLLAERVTRLQHTLRRRGTGNGNADQKVDRFLLTEASRILSDLRKRQTNR